MWTSELHGAVAHASQDQIIGKLDVPPGKVVEAIVFKLEIMNYELGRTKTANIEDPMFNGALGPRPSQRMQILKAATK